MVRIIAKCKKNKKSGRPLLMCPYALSATRSTLG